MSFVSLSSVPQAMQTGFGSRLRLGQTSLFVTTQPHSRLHKRPTSSYISYAEVDEDVDDDDDDEPGFGRHGSGIKQETQKVDARKSETKKAAEKTKHVAYTDKQMAQLAASDEVLVPLRLSLDAENNRVSDFFLWNVNEPSLTPEEFATITCADLDLPVGYTTNIANSIKQQLTEYSELAKIQLPSTAGVHVIIHLSLILDKQLFEDKFEWDMDSSLTPEEFARVVVADLGLSGEFLPAIAHAIHERILAMKREVLEGHSLPAPDNQAVFGRPAGLRLDQAGLGEEWSPVIEILANEDLEQLEVERERMIRRLKREPSRLGSELDFGAMFGRKRRRFASPAVDSPSW